MREMPYFLGAPLWSHAPWRGRLFPESAPGREFLRHYARVFNTVEGNTTFYALPAADTVVRWREATPAHFRFSFKLPQQVTHRQRLRHAEAPLGEFLQRLAPLEERLGPFMIQLPAAFGPADLPVLKTFLARVPEGFRYAVELRHPGFFIRADLRQALNSCLRQRGVDRVIFESRPVHAAPPLDAATREAHERKPRLPVQLDTTGPHPILRYIGHPLVEDNPPWLDRWIAQTARWIGEGLRPYIFIHTPSNDDVPELARRFHLGLQQRLPDLPQLPSGMEQSQESLF